MVGDDQYEIFWYDIKLPELLEENDSARKKIMSYITLISSLKMVGN